MRRCVLLLVAALALAACGSDAGADGPDVAGEWELSAGTADGVPLARPDGARATLDLTGDEARGRSFCNHWSASYRLDGSSLAFDGIGGTEMGCDPDVMAAESAYLAALTAVGSAAVDGDELVLTGEGVELRFSRVAPVPDRELVGTRWVLESLVDGETAGSTVGEPAVLELAGDGTVRGSTGCRALSGTWTSGGGDVLLPDLRADGNCPPDVARQDAHVVEVLGDGFSVQVEGDRLTLTTPAGRGLGYRAE